MKFASIRRRWCIALLCTVLNGCMFLEPPPDMPPPAQPVVLHYGARSEPPLVEGAQEIASYLRRLQRMSGDALRIEIMRAEKDLGSAPSLLERIKFGFALTYGTATLHQYERALSLLGDAEVTLDKHPDLVGWVRYTNHVLTRLSMHAERELKLDRERKEVLKSNEMLSRELSERKSEVARLEKQLAELKSIETSIIQRKSGEDITPP